MSNDLYSTFLALIKKVDEAWIQTYTGKQLHILNPKPEEICLRDIAHALSLMCRYNGHIQGHVAYSVAQHCVLVSNHCNPEDALYGLLHDASEFAMADIVSPFKRSPQMENYRYYENQLQSMVYRKFGLDSKEPPSVKYSDQLILSTEAVSFLHQPLHPEWKLPYEPLPFKILPSSPQEAEQLFLNRFKELVGTEKFLAYMEE